MRKICLDIGICPREQGYRTLLSMSWKRPTMNARIVIPIGERFDPIDMILVASVLGTGAIRIDPETEFRGHGLSDRQDQTFSNMVYDVL